MASESLEKRNIQRVRRIDESIAVSPVRSADQALFYSALVDNYMTLMQKLLRDTIGTKALITSGTTPTYINEAYSERNLDYSGAVQSTDYVRYVNDRPAGIAQSGIAQDRFLGSLSYMTRNARVGKPHIIGNYLMPNISGRTGEMLTILPFFATYQGNHLKAIYSPISPSREKLGLYNTRDKIDFFGGKCNEMVS